MGKKKPNKRAAPPQAPGVGTLLHSPNSEDTALRAAYVRALKLQKNWKHKQALQAINSVKIPQSHSQLRALQMHARSLLHDMESDANSRRRRQEREKALAACREARDCAPDSVELARFYMSLMCKYGETGPDFDEVEAECTRVRGIEHPSEPRIHSFEELADTTTVEQVRGKIAELMMLAYSKKMVVHSSANNNAAAAAASNNSLLVPTSGPRSDNPRKRPYGRGVQQRSKTRNQSGMFTGTSGFLSNVDFSMDKDKLFRSSSTASPSAAAFSNPFGSSSSSPPSIFTSVQPAFSGAAFSFGAQSHPASSSSSATSSSPNSSAALSITSMISSSSMASSSATLSNPFGSSSSPPSMFTSLQPVFSGAAFSFGAQSAPASSTSSTASSSPSSASALSITSVISSSSTTSLSSLALSNPFGSTSSPPSMLMLGHPASSGGVSSFGAQSTPAFSSPSPQVSSFTSASMNSSGFHVETDTDMSATIDQTIAADISSPKAEMQPTSFINKSDTMLEEAQKTENSGQSRIFTDISSPKAEVQPTSFINKSDTMLEEAQKTENSGQSGIFTDTSIVQVHSSGLENFPRDNNYFLNSFFQAPWKLRSFQNKFLETRSSHQHTGDPCIICTLHGVFIELKKASEVEGRIVSSKSLSTAMADYYPNKNFFQQEQMNDHIDLFDVVFNRMHESYTSPSERKYTGPYCGSKHCIPHCVFGLKKYEKFKCHSCELEYGYSGATYSSFVPAAELQNAKVKCFCQPLVLYFEANKFAREEEQLAGRCKALKGQQAQPHSGEQEKVDKLEQEESEPTEAQDNGFSWKQNKVIDYLETKMMDMERRHKADMDYLKMELNKLKMRQKKRPRRVLLSRNKAVRPRICSAENRYVKMGSETHSYDDEVEEAAKERPQPHSSPPADTTDRAA